MAELALGIVGVVPLIGGAMKAYKEVNGKLKLFRHSSREVKKVHKVLRIQRQVFANECGLWLRLIMDDDEVASEMASDPSHDGWNDPYLDNSFRSRLKKNYDAWFEITKDISDNIEILETQISSYEASPETKNKGGKLKKVLMRTKDGIKVAFNASDFEDTIEKLRLSNNELKGLREQIGELHKPKSQSSNQARCSKRGDWATLIRIRRASKALHEALIRAWNCGQPGHLGHVVKLFVETHRVEGDIQMNLAIVCRNHTEDLIQSKLVQLEVRSQNLEWIEQPRIHGQLPSPDDGRSESRKRLKVVRFAETTVQTLIQEPHTSTTITSEQDGACGSCDLGSSKDICKELTRQLNASCLGHIDVRSDEAFRHSFYPARDDLCRRSLPPSPSEDRAITMDEVLDESSRDFFSTVDRLKLARTLVSAVLKFHSTPWLSDFWRLRDLAFFRSTQGEEMSEAIRTLHVGVEVAQRQLDSMEDIQSSADCPISQVTEDERLFCGIDNLTLHSLGVALLQIDRWTRVEPGDVLKLALLGFAALSIAAPQFGIGEGSVILIPGGNSPTIPPVIRPGRRHTDATLTKRDDDLDALKDTYLALLEPYTSDNKPSVGTYMILLHLADILASKGINVDTLALGEASVTFGPSTKRQIFEIGGCKESDVIGLRATLTSLLLIYGNKPPFEIWNLEQAIIAALKACNEDVIGGPIIPDQPIPGGPMIPDKPVPGGPIIPDEPVPGGPIATQSPVPGGPMKPSD
ncbi:hypothetical protein CkaCkLH20_11015 [Colletotrichum karsti]|uniref:DUF7580 domain-containing protein n=1 Tax=Colletotrichum karsti TaxID=1095194 RepID=A0A9P6HV57_9PEZI|nr:uncharacterized protein CkaCkLH20_11015 [Colletotrichum karsti]KAF9871368.1 hypothetical protein CkaCkLH20_11015 [Colletotrichum karsti]